MIEVFLDIKGYEGLYQVSNYGRVRSLVDCNAQTRELILKARMNRCGYLAITLHKNAKMKTYSIHRLVAEAFIPNPDGLPCVNHIDEDKTNNRADNLEWCTAKYNCNYGTRNKRGTQKRSKRIYQYTKDGAFIQSYNSLKEAQKQTGTKGGAISRASHNIRKSAGGYIWSFIPPTPTTTRVLF